MASRQLPAGGRAVVTAGGGTAVVEAIRAVPGAAAMWDLTVSDVHTFAVVAGAYVVHNCDYADAEAQLTRDRKIGVEEAWKQERELVSETGEGAREWTPEEKQELLDTGRVRGYEGHHIYSAREYPELAANPNNIEFLGPGRNPHLIAHVGDFRNPTFGDGFLYRQTLIDMFDLGM